MSTMNREQAARLLKRHVYTCSPDEPLAEALNLAITALEVHDKLAATREELTGLFEDVHTAADDELMRSRRPRIVRQLKRSIGQLADLSDQRPSNQKHREAWLQETA